MTKNKFKYSLGEELISAISHGVGAIFAIVALVLLLIRAIDLKTTVAITSALIYGISLIVLYTMSTLYHSLSPNLKAKKVFRILDHCSIYLLIVGTYTPILLYAMGTTKGLMLFIIMLIIATTGIVLNAVSVEKFKVPSFISYLLLGWLVVFSLEDFLLVVKGPALKLIIAGGIAYTSGALIYLVGKRVKYMHSVWHFFVLVGSILHFLAIYLYILQ